jgi:hypothetical protein
MPDQCPGADTATVADSKLDYLLVLDPGKAACFEQLGFTTSNATELREILLTELPNAPVADSRSNKGGGMNYAVRMTVTGPTGSAEFRTIWSTTSGETGFVTAYPWRDKKRTTTLR